jgi:WD40 repeat protein/serine/threonine protein kinase
MQPSSQQDSAQAAEDAFSDFLRLVDDGQDVDFEAFCRERPRLADALRGLRTDWERMGGAVDRLGEGFPDENPSVVSELISGDESGSGSSSRISSELSATFELDVEGREQISASGSVVSNVIERLSSGSAGRRYAPRGEIARGGMGVVRRVWDTDLRRNLAMKVMLDRKQRRGARDSSSETRQIGRFLEEAQITGQLDHPGIVPVHELGLNDSGQLYFTMRLVRGRDLRAILELVHDERDGWTVARALSVIQRVCEAMAYAHTKRVIHRDIKPSNIMVGRFGEVYVMDWGLAKVMGRKDMHDLRPNVHTDGEHEGLDTISQIHTERTEDADNSSDSPLLTVDGTVVGTPSYMAPEQANGQVDAIGPASDVYSVGALLYQLLTERMPYIVPGERVSPYTVLNSVRQGPPLAIHQIDKKVPPELAAICEKAMARQIDQRYPDMEAMANDLRAFLEGRVVHTYEAGAMAEARKWVVRNKVIAAVLAMGLAALSYLLVDLVLTNNDLNDEAIRANAATINAERASLERIAALDRLTAKIKLASDEGKRANANARTAEGNAYISNIAAADASLRFHELNEADKSLKACPPNLQNWEWQHLKLKADPSLVTFSGHTQRVTTVAFNPRGAVMASGSWDGTVRIWGVSKRSQLHVLDNDGEAIEALAFHPNGQTLAVAGHNGRITLWDAVGGTRLSVPLLQDPISPEGNSRVRSLVFSPNGKQLFAGTQNRKIWTWNVDNAVGSPFPTEHNGPVTSLAISSDGHTLVSGSTDHSVRIWNIETAHQTRSLNEHSDAVLTVAFSSAAPYVATGSRDGEILLFDIESGAMIRKFEGHTGAVNSLDFDADGTRLLSAADDGTLRRWDTYSGEELSVLVGHEGPVWAAAFSPDGIYLASAGEDTQVKLWDRAYSAAITSLDGHADAVRSFAVSPDGLRIVSASQDGRLHLWETDTLVSLAAHDLPAIGGAAVAFGPNGLLIAAGLTTRLRDADHPIMFWDGSRHDELQLLDLVAAGHRQRINALAFSPQGDRVASASKDGTIRIWSAGDGELLHTLAGHTGAVFSLAFHPTKPVLASGGYDGNLRIWDLVTGAELTMRADLEGEVSAVAWSPDGGILATTHGKLVCLRDESYETTNKLIGHQDRVTSLSFHPDGQRLASASLDGTIRLWTTRNPESTSHVLTLRTGQKCPAVAFSPDGRRLYAALGKSLRVFETSGPAVTFDLRRGRLGAMAAARRVFQDRLDRYVGPAAVIENLDQDLSLELAVRTEALRLARNFGTDAERLAESAWVSLRHKDAGHSPHASALRLARAAHNMLPGHARILGVLGAAHYRQGDNLSALTALNQAHALDTPDSPEATRRSAWHLLLMAMAQHKLGRIEEARLTLDEARTMRGDEIDPTTTSLEFEAIELIGLERNS